MEYVVPMGVASDVRTNTNVVCDGELKTSARGSSSVSSYCSEDLITTVRSKPSSILNNKEPVIIAPTPRQLEGRANQKGNANDDVSREKSKLNGLPGWGKQAMSTYAVIHSPVMIACWFMKLPKRLVWATVVRAKRG
mmetsp:Transcript_43626/g.44141  ORF Transcript_43626/g.44141 Transcript_43626/m.44141 type:complete len:137 (-) Transcript_43626:737-1147(-)